MNMNTEEKTKQIILEFIRQKLTCNNERKRFDMGSNYGESMLHNLNILLEFAYLGIYDYTSFLSLDFCKGNPTIYLKYHNEDKFITIDLGGESLTTSEIIYEIFKLTIFSNKYKRHY